MSTTLNDLLVAVRDRIDETTANRWSDVELTRYINRRVTWLQSKIEQDNDSFFVRVQDQTAAAGSNKLGFPSCMFGQKIRSIQVYDGTDLTTSSGRRLSPKPHEWIYDHLQEVGRPDGYTSFAKYFQFASTLSLDSTFRIVYSIKESALTASGQPLGYIKDEWTDIISDAAAIDALVKTGEYERIQILTSIINDRISEMANDLQSNDTIMMPQQRID